MKRGSKVGIVCCSDGQSISNQGTIKSLKNTLEQMGLVPVLSRYIYGKDSVFSGTGKEKADALMEFYRDGSVEAVFDISGGDLANEILPYLDFHVIKNNQKQFWGYSDLTTVINAIYSKTGNSSVLYQVRNLVYDCGKRQRTDFCNSILDGGSQLFSLKTEFVQGERLHGVVVGGNIRCLLKLAGTCYWPDMRGKILLLESYSGTVARMTTYLCQLEQMGVFKQVAGILLGTFTQMEQTKCQPAITELVKKYAGEDMPIVKTAEIGHGTDSKAILIGEEMELLRTVCHPAPE